MRRFLGSTRGLVARVFAVVVFVTLMTVLAPQAFPVQVTQAATTWYNRQITWWMDDSTNSDNGGDVYRVKMTLAWQTTDPHSICYSWANAAPDGTRFPAFNDGVSQCPWYRYGNQATSYDWYPSRYQNVQCWISNAFLITVVINHCGRIADAQDYPPYWTTWGSIFQLCTGIYNTPFSYCGTFRSKLTILGSTVELWNSTAG